MSISTYVPASTADSTARPSIRKSAHRQASRSRNRNAIEQIEVTPNSARRNRRVEPVLKPYEPTSDERSAIESFRARRKRTPQLKVKKKRGKEIVSIDHPDLTSAQAVLLRALGTIEPDFLNGILNQVANTRCIREGSTNIGLTFCWG